MKNIFYMNYKNINYSFVFRLNLFSLYLLLHVVCFAQWQPDQRLTNNPFASITSEGDSKTIAVSGDTVHIVWFDTRDGNKEIYYKRSTDLGINWGVDTRLTFDSLDSGYPSVAVSGQFVYVIWQDNDLAGHNWVFFKRSTNSGVNWDAGIQLVNYSSNSPSIATEGLNVYVAWIDMRSFNEDLYFKRSTDGGSTWNTDVHISNSGASYAPSIAVSGLTIHIAYSSISSLTGDLYSHSTDGGVTWLSPILLDSNNFTDGPSVAVNGLIVHFLWTKYISPNTNLYYKRSTDNGITWEPKVTLTNNPSSARFVGVTVSSAAVHIVWDAAPNSNYDIFYIRSTNNGVNWESNVQLTNNSAYSGNPSIVASSQGVHVLWNDGRDGNGEIYYKRNPTGNIVDISHLSSSFPNSFSLSQNYPNPFNPVTKIKFNISSVGNGRDLSVKLIIYDVLGKAVTTLINEQLQPGSYSIDWDASNFPSGVYFYKLESGDFSESKKMLMVK